MLDLFLAAPWWLVALLIAVGGVVAWSGLNRQQSGPRNVGLGLIALAILLFVVSFFYETDKAKVSRLTLELVKSVQDKDWSKFASLMDSDVSLDVAGGTGFASRMEVVQAAKDDAERYKLSAVSAHVTQVVQDPAGIVVDIDATSRQSVMGMDYPVPSSWKMSWNKTGTEWKLHQISCLSVGTDKTSNAAAQYIGKR